MPGWPGRAPHPMPGCLPARGFTLATHHPHAHMPLEDCCALPCTLFTTMVEREPLILGPGPLFLPQQMTYVKQLEEYEEAVMRKRLEEMPEGGEWEVQRLGKGWGGARWGGVGRVTRAWWRRF